nr:hypothetical protein [uncultured Devosia sp.]
MPTAHLRLTKTAYLPEASAYRTFLDRRGWTVTASIEHADANCDIEILFPGHFPFWKTASSSRRVVYDYTSASVPPFPVAKNLLKSATERAPDGRIFLSEFVRSCFWFYNPRPHIVRDMGIDEELFADTRSSSPAYDIIYAGSVRGRTGLILKLNALGEMGCTVLLVGEVSPEDKSHLHKNIVLTGRVSRPELPGLYSQARFGLNFTPDVYPFNRQTSTKTLEYLASGLGIISTRGQWVEQFARDRGANIVWLDDLKTINQLNDFVISPVSVRDLSWENVLVNSQLDTFLRALLK